VWMILTWLQLLEAKARCRRELFDTRSSEARRHGVHRCRAQTHHERCCERPARAEAVEHAVPEPTTLAECHEYDGENRSLLERRAVLAVHGPPTALKELWASARAKAALPTLCGLTVRGSAQAASMQLLSAAASWDAT
jgi:hypothetical protein